MTNIFTCKCGYQLTLKKEALGKKVKCKGCNEILDIPEDIRAAPLENIPTTANSEQPILSTMAVNEIECPFCVERIPKTSLTCPFCSESLVKKLSLSQEQTEQLFNEYKTSIANNQEVNFNIKSKFSNGSSVLLFITLCFLSLAIWGFFSPKEKTTLLVIGLIVTIIFAIIFIMYYLKDQKARNIQSISDPILFFNVYFNSLSNHRINYTYHAIAPLGRSAKITKLLPFAIIAKDKKQYDISSKEGFKKYWKSTLGGSGVYFRSMKIIKTRLTKDTQEYSIIETTLEMSSYNQLLLFLLPLGVLIAALAISLTTKKETIILRKILIKHDNKWFVAEGEFQGNLDFATFKQENI